MHEVEELMHEPGAYLPFMPMMLEEENSPTVYLF